MNTQNKRLQSHEDVLEAIADAIDIPESMYKEAEKKYNLIGEWLERPASILYGYDPKIYTQGSFALGTVIRPIGDKDEYDIDLVCKLERATKLEFTTEKLKVDVGKEVASYARDKDINNPEDKRRCWTLNYGGNFHMDILPSLPDAQGYKVLMESMHSDLATNKNIIQEAIAITDKLPPEYKIMSKDWLVSNPKGYKTWFDDRQINVASTRKMSIVESSAGVYESVDDVPNHSAKTPLQRAIQLLKRHRDVMFKDDGDDKPISVIITTLAAHAYNNEDTISGALESILNGMHQFIEQREGEFWIENPVNPKENFADKWKDEPHKKESFDIWLKRARRDFGMYLNSKSYNEIPVMLQESLSKITVGKILPLIGLSAPAVASNVDIPNQELKNRGQLTRAWGYE